MIFQPAGVVQERWAEEKERVADREELTKQEHATLSFQTNDNLSLLPP